MNKTKISRITIKNRDKATSYIETAFNDGGVIWIFVGVILGVIIVSIILPLILI